MLNLVSDAQKELRGIIGSAFAKAFPNSDCGEYVVEIPKDTSHGDFACNVAMLNAK
ncbi:MAG: hypothetical protein RR209_00120, partial [Angelakisella sp.]